MRNGCLKLLKGRCSLRFPSTTHKHTLAIKNGYRGTYSRATHTPSSSTNFCEKSLTTHLIPLRRHFEQLDAPGLISQRILCRLHSAPGTVKFSICLAYPIAFSLSSFQSLPAPLYVNARTLTGTSFRNLRKRPSVGNSRSATVVFLRRLKASIVGRPLPRRGGHDEWWGAGRGYSGTTQQAWNASGTVPLVRVCLFLLAKSKSSSAKD